MKTAVLAKYNSPSSERRVLEYLINITNPTICPTNRRRLPYFIIMALRRLLFAALIAVLDGDGGVDSFVDSSSPDDIGQRSGLLLILSVLISSC